MSDDTIGTAREAAELLGLSLSQFNARRRAVTREYDPATGETFALPSKDDLPEDTSLREYLRDRHLVAPTLAGNRMPRGSWEFNLTVLQEYREQGWPGARFPTPVGGD